MIRTLLFAQGRFIYINAEILTFHSFRLIAVIISRFKTRINIYAINKYFYLHFGFRVLKL